MGQLAAAELLCRFDSHHTHIHTRTRKNRHTPTHSCEGRGTNPIPFSIGIRPDAPVGFLYYFHFHHLHTHTQREREWERERQQDRQWVRACARHINVRWECKWSYSCETAACCKESGLCRPTPCQRVFGHRAELWERAAEKDPGMFSWMDKNSPQSISVVGLTGDKRANKSFHSVWRDGLMWLSVQIYVCVSIFFQCLAGCQASCQTFITALFRLSLNTTSECYEHASHIWTLTLKASELPSSNSKIQKVFFGIRQASIFWHASDTCTIHHYILKKQADTVVVSVPHWLFVLWHANISSAGALFYIILCRWYPATNLVFKL